MSETVDLAVIGAGPAGLAAATAAANYGLSVILLDEQPAPGGQIYRNIENFDKAALEENLGEDFETAMRDDSLFSQAIRRLDPNDVTISIWVYPDSFGQFSKLKRYLYEKGFLCAGWPLPEDQPISGSPNGFRTAAQ